MQQATHKKWLDELTLELRLRDFSGAAVGEALATVEEFVADSGQDPESEFGPARHYAAELAAVAPRPDRRGLRLPVTVGVSSLVIFLVYVAALTAWADGTALLIGGVQLFCWAVAAALILLLPRYLSLMMRNVWTLAAIPLVGAALGIGAVMGVPETAAGALLALTPAPVLLGTAGLLIALAVASTVVTLRSEPDTIRSPLAARQTPTTASRWAELLTAWLFPLLALVTLGSTLLLASLA